MSSIPNPQNPYVDPIPQKTTVALINLVVVRFSDFLNKFYANTEEKLLELEKRIDTIDTVLLLLEKKLDSVPPEFYNARPVQNYQDPQQGAYQGAPSDAQQAAAEQVIDPENDPNREEYVRFIKMHKMGVPLQALRVKMQAEGLDPVGIEKYIDIDPADRTVAAPVSMPRVQQNPPPQNAPPQNAQPENPEPQNEQPAPAADDEEREQYAKFIKLHKMGIPLQALKLKMNAEGLDPDGIDKYLPVE